jgi:hypothetical protein
VLSPSVAPNRARLIIVNQTKWVNGTVLHYYFFDKPTDGENVTLDDGSTRFASWVSTDAEKAVARQAFTKWKDLGIGLEFKEVGSRGEAEVRIGFMRGDGAWSYIGRDVLRQGRDDRTMNFGWDITEPGEIDTAIHEIGHTIGFPHEHQSPNAGIVWNEEAVYAALAAPPNRWSRQTTFDNIISKIPSTEVRGSNWDPNSIMEYPFEAGLIQEPATYRKGLTPAGGLSQLDTTYAKTFYPALTSADVTDLNPLRAVPLDIAAGQQKNLRVIPAETRLYEIRTVGTSDTVMVLFEDVAGELRYRTADDDGGEDRNAFLRVKLFQGRTYMLRVRLYYSDRAGGTAVVMS